MEGPINGSGCERFVKSFRCCGIGSFDGFWFFVYHPVSLTGELGDVSDIILVVVVDTINFDFKCFVRVIVKVWNKQIWSDSVTFL